MQDLYDLEFFKQDEYKPESKGVILAKRVRLVTNIIRLYGVAMLFIVYYWIFYRENWHFERWLFNSAKINLGIAIVLFVQGIIVAYRAYISAKAQDYSLQERFDYDLIVYHQRSFLSLIGRNYILFTMAKLQAKMGDKKQCGYALNRVSPSYKHEQIGVLRNWINSDTELDSSIFETPKAIKPLKLLFIHWLIAFSFGFVCTHYTNYYWYGFSKLFVGFLGLLSMAGFSIIPPMIYINGLAFYSLKTGKEFSTKKTRMGIYWIIAVISIIINVICRFDIIEFAFDLDTNEYSEESVSEDYEEYTGSADYTVDYYGGDEGQDYYMDDVTIMNQMIILCEYLVDEGVISDFSVELGYNAKGNVNAQIAKDDDYVYMLYDNGLKDDDNGNQCIELVLEAEPLDDNGNSLGQSEASLKGFYLVNAENKTVIDEHKTHW